MTPGGTAVVGAPAPVGTGVAPDLAIFEGWGLGGIVTILLVVGGLFVYATYPQLRRLRGLRPVGRLPYGREARREVRAEETLAALAEAAEDDPAFDADALLDRAFALVPAAHHAWDARDREALRPLLGDHLYASWTTALDGYAWRSWHSRSRILGGPLVTPVGVVHRRRPEDDRVVVHVEVGAMSWIDTPQGRTYEDGRQSARRTLSEYWTLGRRGEEWVLLATETNREGDHHLDAELVATPDRDPELWDRSRSELAAADATGTAASTAALVPASLTDDARATALDLALVDDRFSPDVLTGDVRATVAAWMAAVDGPDDALRARATPEAIRALLYAEDDERIRTVVRGVALRDVLVDLVDGDAVPPRIEVRLRYRAHWYREDTTTRQVVEGWRSAPVPREARWTFVLSDRADAIWRLAAA